MTFFFMEKEKSLYLLGEKCIIWNYGCMLGSHFYFFFIIAIFLFINSFGTKFQTIFVVCFAFFFLNKLLFEKKLICRVERLNVKSIDLDETAHYKPSYLDLLYLQMPIIIPLHKKYGGWGWLYCFQLVCDSLIPWFQLHLRSISWERMDGNRPNFAYILTLTSSILGLLGMNFRKFTT